MLADPADALATAAHAAAALAHRLVDSAERLAHLRDRDVSIATTPKDLVWQQDKVTLHQYRPRAPRRVGIPLLICYGLIGRWTMTDLQDDRSLVRNLLDLGIDLYVVDWGTPTRADCWITLDDYICGYLDGCMRAIAARHAIPAVNLLGICEGGVFATCYAALRPARVATLTLAVTPIDFHADRLENRAGHGFINLWTRALSAEDVDALVDSYGNLPGTFMGAMFNAMTPVRTMLKYNLDLLEVIDDEKRLLNWLRMEKWLADRPDHPGAAAKQWLKDFYQQNKLARNELVLDGVRVDLRRLTAPVLNVFALDDHIIPPATSRALGGLIGSTEYAELALPGGHVGVFVGGKSQTVLAPAVAAFLERERPGALPLDATRASGPGPHH